MTKGSTTRGIAVTRTAYPEFYLATGSLKKAIHQM
jgi:hypothetical protein